MSRYDRLIRRLAGLLREIRLDIIREEATSSYRIRAITGDRSISVSVTDEVLANANDPIELADNIAQVILRGFNGDGGETDEPGAIPLPVELMKDLETSKPGATEDRIREILSKPDGSESVTLNTGAWQGNSISFAATTMASFSFMTSATMQVFANTAGSWRPM